MLLDKYLSTKQISFIILNEECDANSEDEKNDFISVLFRDNDQFIDTRRSYALFRNIMMLIYFNVRIDRVLTKQEDYFCQFLISWFNILQAHFNVTEMGPLIHYIYKKDSIQVDKTDDGKLQLVEKNFLTSKKIEMLRFSIKEIIDICVTHSRNIEDNQFQQTLRNGQKTINKESVNSHVSELIDFMLFVTNNTQLMDKMLNMLFYDFFSVVISKSTSNKQSENQSTANSPTFSVTRAPEPSGLELQNPSSQELVSITKSLHLLFSYNYLIKRISSISNIYKRVLESASVTNEFMKRFCNDEYTYSMSMEFVEPCNPVFEPLYLLKDRDSVKGNALIKVLLQDIENMNDQSLSLNKFLKCIYNLQHEYQNIILSLTLSDDRISKSQNTSHDIDSCGEYNDDNWEKKKLNILSCIFNGQAHHFVQRKQESILNLMKIDDQEVIIPNKYLEVLENKLFDREKAILFLKSNKACINTIFSSGNSSILNNVKKLFMWSMIDIFIMCRKDFKISLNYSDRKDTGMTDIQKFLDNYPTRYFYPKMIGNRDLSEEIHNEVMSTNSIKRFMEDLNLSSVDITTFKGIILKELENILKHYKKTIRGLIKEDLDENIKKCKYSKITTLLDECGFYKYLSDNIDEYYFLNECSINIEGMMCEKRRNYVDDDIFNMLIKHNKDIELVTWVLSKYIHSLYFGNHKTVIGNQFVSNNNNKWEIDNDIDFVDHMNGVYTINFYNCEKKQGARRIISSFVYNFLEKFQLLSNVLFKENDVAYRYIKIFNVQDIIWYIRNCEDNDYLNQSSMDSSLHIINKYDPRRVKMNDNMLLILDFTDYDEENNWPVSSLISSYIQHLMNLLPYKRIISLILMKQKNHEDNETYSDIFSRNHCDINVSTINISNFFGFDESLCIFYENMIDAFPQCVAMYNMLDIFVSSKIKRITEYKISGDISNTTNMSKQSVNDGEKVNVPKTLVSDILRGNQSIRNGVLVRAVHSYMKKYNNNFDNFGKSPFYYTSLTLRDLLFSYSQSNRNMKTSYYNIPLSLQVDSELTLNKLLRGIGHITVTISDMLDFSVLSFLLELLRKLENNDHAKLLVVFFIDDTELDPKSEQVKTNILWMIKAIKTIMSPMIDFDLLFSHLFMGPEISNRIIDMKQLNSLNGHKSGIYVETGEKYDLEGYTDAQPNANTKEHDFINVAQYNYVVKNINFLITFKSEVNPLFEFVRQYNHISVSGQLLEINKKVENNELSNLEKDKRKTVKLFKNDVKCMKEKFSNKLNKIKNQVFKMNQYYNQCVNDKLYNNVCISDKGKEEDSDKNNEEDKKESSNIPFKYISMYISKIEKILGKLDVDYLYNLLSILINVMNNVNKKENRKQLNLFMSFDLRRKLEKGDISLIKSETDVIIKCAEVFPFFVLNIYKTIKKLISSFKLYSISTLNKHLFLSLINTNYNKMSKMMHKLNSRVSRMEERKKEINQALKIFERELELNKRKYAEKNRQLSTTITNLNRIESIIRIFLVQLLDFRRNIYDFQFRNNIVEKVIDTRNFLVATMKKDEQDEERNKYNIRPQSSFSRTGSVIFPTASTAAPGQIGDVPVGTTIGDPLSPIDATKQVPKAVIDILDILLSYAPLNKVTPYYVIIDNTQYKQLIYDDQMIVNDTDPNYTNNSINYLVENINYLNNYVENKDYENDDNFNIVHESEYSFSNSNKYSKINGREHVEISDDNGLNIAQIGSMIDRSTGDFTNTFLFSNMANLRDSPLQKRVETGTTTPIEGIRNEISLEMLNDDAKDLELPKKNKKEWKQDNFNSIPLTITLPQENNCLNSTLTQERSILNPLYRNYDITTDFNRYTTPNIPKISPRAANTSVLQSPKRGNNVDNTPKIITYDNFLQQQQQSTIKEMKTYNYNLTPIIISAELFGAEKADDGTYITPLKYNVPYDGSNITEYLEKTINNHNGKSKTKYDHSRKTTIITNKDQNTKVFTIIYINHKYLTTQQVKFVNRIVSFINETTKATPSSPTIITGSVKSSRNSGNRVIPLSPTLIRDGTNSNSRSRTEDYVPVVAPDVSVIPNIIPTKIVLYSNFINRFLQFNIDGVTEEQVELILPYLSVLVLSLENINRSVFSIIKWVVMVLKYTLNRIRMDKMVEKRDKLEKEKIENNIEAIEALIVKNENYVNSLTLKKKIIKRRLVETTTKLNTLKRSMKSIKHILSSYKMPLWNGGRWELVGSAIAGLLDYNPQWSECCIAASHMFLSNDINTHFPKESKHNLKSITENYTGELEGLYLNKLKKSTQYIPAPVGTNPILDMYFDIKKINNINVVTSGAAVQDSYLNDYLKFCAIVATPQVICLHDPHGYVSEVLGAYYGTAATYANTFKELEGMKYIKKVVIMKIRSYNEIFSGIKNKILGSILSTVSKHSVRDKINKKLLKHRINNDVDIRERYNVNKYDLHNDSLVVFLENLKRPLKLIVLCSEYPHGLIQQTNKLTTNGINVPLLTMNFSTSSLAMLFALKITKGHGMIKQDIVLVDNLTKALKTKNKEIMNCYSLILENFCNERDINRKKIHSKELYEENNENCKTKYIEGEREGITDMLISLSQSISSEVNNDNHSSFEKGVNYVGDDINNLKPFESTGKKPDKNDDILINNLGRKLRALKLQRNGLLSEHKENIGYHIPIPFTKPLIMKLSTALRVKSEISNTIDNILDSLFHKFNKLSTLSITLSESMSLLLPSLILVDSREMDVSKIIARKKRNMNTECNGLMGNYEKATSCPSRPVKKLLFNTLITPYSFANKGNGVSLSSEKACSAFVDKFILNRTYEDSVWNVNPNHLLNLAYSIKPDLRTNCLLSSKTTDVVDELLSTKGKKESALRELLAVMKIKEMKNNIFEETAEGVATSYNNNIDDAFLIQLESLSSKRKNKLFENYINPYFNKKLPTDDSDFNLTKNLEIVTYAKQGQSDIERYMYWLDNTDRRDEEDDQIDNDSDHNSNEKDTDTNGLNKLGTGNDITAYNKMLHSILTKMLLVADRKYKEGIFIPMIQSVENHGAHIKRHSIPISLLLTYLSKGLNYINSTLDTFPRYISKLRERNMNTTKYKEDNDNSANLSSDTSNIDNDVMLPPITTNYSSLIPYKFKRYIDYLILNTHGQIASKQQNKELIELESKKAKDFIQNGVSKNIDPEIARRLFHETIFRIINISENINGDIEGFFNLVNIIGDNADGVSIPDYIGTMDNNKQSFTFPLGFIPSVLVNDVNVSLNNYMASKAGEVVICEEQEDENNYAALRKFGNLIDLESTGYQWKVKPIVYKHIINRTEKYHIEDKETIDNETSLNLHSFSSSGLILFHISTPSIKDRITLLETLENINTMISSIRVRSCPRNKNISLLISVPRDTSDIVMGNRFNRCLENDGYLDVLDAYDTAIEFGTQLSRLVTENIYYSFNMDVNNSETKNLEFENIKTSTEGILRCLMARVYSGGRVNKVSLASSLLDAIYHLTRKRRKGDETNISLEDCGVNYDGKIITSVTGMLRSLMKFIREKRDMSPE